MPQCALDTTRIQLLVTRSENFLSRAIDAANSLGLDEKSIERQKYFITNIADVIDMGVGSMVDADMESEAAKLQAYQVRQQLASQSLSLANNSPQRILNLFN